MSARYEPVGWNRSKLVYDGVLVAVVLLYLWLYVGVGAAGASLSAPLDAPSLAMQATGSCAFLLLTAVLAIGPAARLSPAMTPLLYNRRHFGVVTCAVALGHAGQVLGWYFSFSPTPQLEALLFTDLTLTSWHGFPFIPFGVAALLILVALAATSHDFWLHFLTPPAWKTLHMGIYLAYGFAVAHVALGALQTKTQPLLAALVTASAVGLAGLHIMAGLKARDADARIGPITDDGWLVVGDVAAIADDHGIVVAVPDGEAVAIFRHADSLSAVSNLCAHQNGPLGEGRVIDGCITCPWHGFQYRLADGCAPAPFTERLATYRLRLDGATILLDPRPNPPGTFVEPLKVPPR